MKKIAVIINPGSGRKMGTNIIKHIDKYNSHDLIFEYKISRNEKHLKELARETFQNYSNIISVGGDTTFTIVVGEILDRYNLNSQKEILEVFKNKTFGMLGLGSANDISDELNTNTVKELIDAIKMSKIKKMDIGLLSSGLQKRVFLGSVSLGLGVSVNRYIESFKNKYKWLGKRIFFVNTFIAVYYILKSFIKKQVPQEYQIIHKDKTIDFSGTLLVVQNCFKYAGGIILSPVSSLFSKSLSLTLVKTKSFISTIGLIPKITAKKASLSPSIEILEFDVVKIKSREPMTLQYDGEIIKGAKTAKIQLLKQILPVYACYD